MLIGIVVSIFLLTSVMVPAFADVLDDRKKIEELKAKAFQKKILSLDYDKIQKKDKGFKTGSYADVKKKHIQNIHHSPIVIKKVAH